MEKKTIKKPSDEADHKKVYTLWREYLKQSGAYKEFCEWVREFQHVWRCS